MRGLRCCSARKDKLEQCLLVSLASSVINFNPQYQQKKIFLGMSVLQSSMHTCTRRNSCNTNIIIVALNYLSSYMSFFFKSCLNKTKVATKQI